MASAGSEAAEAAALEADRVEGFVDAYRRAYDAVVRLQGLMGLPARADFIVGQAHRALLDMAATAPPEADLGAVLGWPTEPSTAGTTAPAGASGDRPSSAADGVRGQAAPAAVRIPTTPLDGPRPPTSPPPRWVPSSAIARPSARPTAALDTEAGRKRRRSHGNRR